MGFEPGSTMIKRTRCLTYPLDHGSFSWGREFFHLPLLYKVAHSLSHSPLPVLTVFELQGLWHHVGAVLPDCQIKKKLLTTSLFSFNSPSQFLPISPNRFPLFPISIPPPLLIFPHTVFTYFKRINPNKIFFKCF